MVILGITYIELIKFSEKVLKYNKRGKKQERILIITNKRLLNIQSRSGYMYMYIYNRVHKAEDRTESNLNDHKKSTSSEQSVYLAYSNRI